MNPKISVVIPCRNGERYLEKTLEAVFRQTYPAHEVIVVDDGSTDSTPQILQKYGDRVKTARLTGVGVCEARDHGFSMATGDFIAFLDHDNHWFRNYLESHVAFIRKFPEVGFLCTNYAERDRNQGFRIRWHFQRLQHYDRLNFCEPLRLDPFELLIVENFVGMPSSCLVRRDIAARVGPFNPDKEMIEDYEYFLRCGRIAKFLLIPEVLVYKRTHSTNSSRDSIRLFIHHTRAMDKTVRALPPAQRTPRIERAYRLSLSENYQNIGNLFYESGNRQSAFEYFRKSCESNPTTARRIIYWKTVIKKTVRELSHGRLRKHKPDASRVPHAPRLSRTMQATEPAPVPAAEGSGRPGMKKTIVANMASNYIMSIVGMVLGFLLVPFLIRKLGKETFGIIALAESAILFFEIFTISVRIALSRHATFSMGQGKREEFVEYLSTGRVIAYVTAAFVLLFTLVVGIFFPSIFRVPAGFEMQSRILFVLISVAFSLTIPNSVYWSVLYAHQRFDMINTAQSVSLVLRAAFIFLFFSILPVSWLTLTLYGAIHLATTIAQNRMVFHWHRKLMPDLKLDFKSYRRDKVREILWFSADNSLSRLNTLLYDNVSNIIINLNWGTAGNAIYSVALKIPTLMKRVFTETTWTLTPTLTDLVARGEKQRFQNLVWLYTKLLAVVTIPVSLAVALVAGPLVHLWVGDQFETAAKMLELFAIFLAFTLPFSICGCVVTAYAKVALPSRVGFVIALFNVGLGILLGQVFGMGIMGIAFANALAWMLYSSGFLPAYMCRVANLPYGRFWLDTFVRPLIFSLLFFGVPFWALHAYHRVDTIGRDSLLIAIVCGTLYMLSVYFFTFNNSERSYVREFAGKLRRKVGL